MSDWKERFEQELAQARAARDRGNEGQARVCARRAAGIAIGEYLRRHHLPDLGPSAYDKLRFLTELPGLPPKVYELAQHLTLRVTEDFHLPVNADLIAETRLLADLLLDEK